MARLKQGAAGPTRPAAGPLFYFDTEYPGHFGHVMTEVVSRYWGWAAARELAPGIRPLISLASGQSTMPAFQRAVFTALGIDADTTEYIHPDECLAVDTLYAATPEFVMPHYAAPDLAAVWERIARGCTPPDTTGWPPRLFISRRPRRIRTCTNWDQVETLFTRHGFTVIYPQDHDFATQVAMFHHAHVIAGFAGSAMITTMFAPGTRIILIAGDSYNATNEQLIRSVIGGELHYFWGESHIKHPPQKWTWDAYQSNFTFDTTRFEDDITALTDT
jgi:capsular polysaccharide biosynthesis protein